MSPRVQLVHWNVVEGESRAEDLRRAGYEVRFEVFDPFPAAFKRLKAEPPDAVVIDLSRLPSAGRDVALAVREAKAVRHIPIVFVDGEEEKVRAIKELLPDATYAKWRGVRAGVRGALARPPADPVVPGSRLAGYSGTPLPRKLGMKPGATVVLLGAPDDFETLLGDLPEGIVVRRDGRGKADLLVWFVRSKAELQKKIVAMSARVGRDGMWIAWPKGKAGAGAGITQNVVRASGLANGLVDYKVAAIDDTWSGLKFTRRKSG